jgi:hypothetical protein
VSDVSPGGGQKYRRGFIVLNIGLPNYDLAESDRDELLRQIETIFNEGGQGNGSGVGPGGAVLHDLFVSLAGRGADTVQHQVNVEQFRKDYPLLYPLGERSALGRCCIAGAVSTPGTCPWHPSE